MAIVRVTKSYIARLTDPISIKAGEAVCVKREDVEFRGWFWCVNNRGKEGWVHNSVLASTNEQTTCVTAYDSTELVVAIGEKGKLLERLGGWLRIQLSDGTKGWLPESHASIANIGVPFTDPRPLDKGLMRRSQ